jgi:hypothetical protein
MKRNLWVGTAVITLAVALGAGSAWLGKRTVVAAAGEQAPKFEVDPFWPKPLPNGWVLGQTIGLAVDAQDNVWIIHRPGSLEAKESYQTRKEADCCTAAPDVLAFDQAGNLIQHWGKVEGHDWPSSNHGITIGERGTSRGRRGARCRSATRRPGRLADVGARGRRGFAWPGHVSRQLHLEVQQDGPVPRTDRARQRQQRQHGQRQRPRRGPDPLRSEDE